MSKIRILFISFLFCLFLGHTKAQTPAATPSETQAETRTETRAETRKTSTPYTGDLSIFDSPGREERLHLDRVMDALGIASGKTVADIGAGGGWFTVRAAKRVTETGTVYAVDINPDAIRYIENRAHKEGLHNVKTILSKADDPLLPPNTVDAVLLLKTYHEVAQPIRLLRNLRPALHPGARVGVIDRNGNGENHGVAREIVVHEFQEAGYTLLSQYDFVKDDGMDYFLVFTVKP
jgi:cyclopropane fatty-acyl-phospholipid synthase-like methyltransferase